MVPVSLDQSAAQLLFARDREPVFKFFHLSAHGAQILDDAPNAVTLLDAELSSVADLHAILALRGQNGQDWHFIDHLGNLSPSDLPATECSRPDPKICHGFASLNPLIQNFN